MARVSIIVPNYNHERYLQQRLESIFSQTFSDFEVLLLDDCSTDQSREIIEHFQADPRVTAKFNCRNSGSPFKQWNKGFNLSKGDYIWIAESDDYAAPRFLETLISKLDANPGIGLAHCQSWIAKDNTAGTPLEVMEKWYQDLPNHERWHDGFENDGQCEIAQYMVFKNTIPNASAVVFRRSLLDKGLRAPEDMRLAGDWMFWVELLLQSRLAYVSEPLNYFRVAHGSSQRKLTGKDGLQLIEGLRVYSRIVGAVPVGQEVQREALGYQVKVWGSLAYRRRIPLKTNLRIYKQLLEQHTDAVSRRHRLITLPFCYYFISVPFRQHLIFRVPVRAAKWLILRMLGRPATSRTGP